MEVVDLVEVCRGGGAGLGGGVLEQGLVKVWSSSGALLSW